MLGEKLCKLFEIKYPIIQGGMAQISEAELVSAVSNAGGLGIIGAGFASPDWLRDQIRETKRKTTNPFGVNLLMTNPHLREQVKVVVEEKVPFVFTGGGNPLPVMQYLRYFKIKVVPVVPFARLAQKMEKNGAFGVVVEGLESGGHIGRSTTFCLIPQAKKLLKKIPLIGAGGIYDGKTMAGALILGADGAQLGTRFLATKEAKIPEGYKKRIISARDEDLEVVLSFTGHPLRVIKNKFSEKLLAMEKEGAFPEEVRAQNLISISENTNPDFAPLMAGISAGGIDKIKKVKEVIEEIIKEAETTIKKFCSLL